MAGVRCTVCESPARYEIDQALAVDAASVRNIAARYGVTPSSVQRHKEHLLPALVKVAQTERRNSNINAFDGLARIYDRLTRVLDACDEQLLDRETGKYRWEPGSFLTLVSAAESLRRTIESAARLMVMLQAEREKFQAQEDAAGDLRALLLEALTEPLGLRDATRLVDLIERRLAEMDGRAP